MRKNNNIEKLMREAGERKHFSVPEGYFGQLPGRVLRRARQTEPERMKKPVVVSLSKVMAVAAAVVFAVFGYFYVHSLRSAENPSAGSTDRVMSEVLPADISENVLYNFIEEEGISAEISLTNDENSEAIIDYLVGEGVDESLLAQQL